MTKRLFAAFFAVFMILSLAACGDGTQGDGTEETTEAVRFAPDLAALRTKMMADFEGVDPVPFEGDMLLDLYGIKAEDVAESACYMTMDGVFPQEIVMIKASSEEAAARVAAALEKRIEEVKIQSANYDPDNYALAQKCKVATRGVYVTMFLSPHFDAMTELFNSAK